MPLWKWAPHWRYWRAKCMFACKWILRACSCMCHAACILACVGVMGLWSRRTQPSSFFLNGVNSTVFYKAILPLKRCKQDHATVTFHNLFIYLNLNHCCYGDGLEWFSCNSNQLASYSSQQLISVLNASQKDIDWIKCRELIWTAGFMLVIDLENRGRWELRVFNHN